MKNSREFSLLFLHLFRGAEMLASFEEDGYAPKCTKPNNRENNACNHMGGA